MVGSGHICRLSRVTQNTQLFFKPKDKISITCTKSKCTLSQILPYANHFMQSLNVLKNTAMNKQKLH